MTCNSSCISGFSISGEGHGTEAVWVLRFRLRKFYLLHLTEPTKDVSNIPLSGMLGYFPKIYLSAERHGFAKVLCLLSLKLVSYRVSGIRDDSAVELETDSSSLGASFFPSDLAALPYCHNYVCSDRNPQEKAGGYVMILRYCFVLASKRLRGRRCFCGQWTRLSTFSSETS